MTEPARRAPATAVRARSAVRTITAATVAGLSGFAVMCVELTAVRLLAPHFGDSAYVWTNVIGVIMAALALGAWWGGRMADRELGRRRLARLFATAAVLLAAVPLVARGLGGLLVPQDLPLDSALPALVRGSLVATLILFGLPILLLGTVTPMLAVLLAGAGTQLGRAVGTVAALSTVGSLTGTFAATHLLVPTLGCRATMWGCALVLAGCALLTRPGRGTAAAAAAVLASLLAHGGPLREPAPGRVLVAERETSQQYLQVVREDSPGGQLTMLQINEGLDSFHSVAVAGSVFTGGRYYDYHAVAPWLAGNGARPADLRVLSVGDAAGTFQRMYAACHPGLRFDGCELDPAAVSLGAQFFGGRVAAGETWSGFDGRVAVERARGRYHVLLLDAYAHQVYIPAQLASREFFAAAWERLAAGGVISVNVGGLHRQDPVLLALASTMAHVFGDAWSFQVPGSRNFVLMARREQPLEPTVLEAASGHGTELREPDREHLRGVLMAMAQERSWQRHDATAGPVLEDDRPELDRLLHRSYVAADDEPVATVAAGRLSVIEAEAQAHAALASQDPLQVLAVARSSAGASAYLRLLCGDARWILRRLHGAESEYLAALAMQPEAALRDVLQGRLDRLRRELVSHARAEQIGRRNGWLAWLAGAIGAVVAIALLRWR